MRCFECRSIRKTGQGGAALFTAVFLSLLWAGCAGTGTDAQDSTWTESGKRIAVFNYNLAEKFWKRDRADLALRHLRAAVKSDPDLHAPRLGILDIYLESGEPQNALFFLDDCSDALNEHPEFLKRRALAMEMLGDAETAGSFLKQAVAKDPDDTELVLAMVENLVLRQKHDAAFTIEYELAGENRGAYDAALGYLCYIRKDYERAGQYLEKAYACDGYTLERDEILALAEIRMRNNEHESAAELLESQLESDPDHAVTRAALAWAYYCAGSRESSRRIMAKASVACEANGTFDAVKGKIGTDEHEE